MDIPPIITFTVVMMWVEERQLWLMLRACSGKMIQEFFDCENIARAFPGLSKDGDNYYDLTIHKIERSRP